MKKILIILIIASVFSCSNNKVSQAKIDALQTEIDSLKSAALKPTDSPQNEISTFLTFQNSDAEEAMNFYVSLFENSRVLDVQKYGKDGPAPEGTIMCASFELNGSKYACSDSYIKHEWDFTPGVSNFVSCTSNEELERLFKALSEDGNIFMPLDNYGFSQKFGFVEDRFGVSWQLNLD